MKTNLKIYLAACSVMAALGSCSQEKLMEGTSESQSKDVHTVSLQANLGKDSRIAFEEGETSLNLLWEEQDSFSVIVGKAVQTPATFVLKEGAGTSNGVFEGEIPCNEGDTLYAVWPIMAQGMSGEHACYWSLAGQKGVLDDRYTFMIGSGVYNKGENVQMSFYYRTAAVRMNLLLPEGVEKITKVDVKVEQYGREGAIVNIDSGGLIFDGGSRNDGLTIENEFTVVDGKVQVVAYFFAWDHSRLNNGKVIVTASDGKEYEGQMVSGNIRPGMLYDTTIEMYEDNNSDFVEEEDGSYTIHTAKGWKTFVSKINGGNTFEGKIIRLGADIDLNNEVQTPIGAREYINPYEDIIFAGTLDGQNYAIKNLRIENTIGNYAGLFAFIQKATLMNLRLVGGEVRGNGYIGAFVGYGRGVTIINCHNEGCKVSHINEDNGYYAGGLTGCLHRTTDGIHYSFIIASSNSAEISGANCPAGITGGAWSGFVTLVACVNTGEISYMGTRTGQINICAAGIASSLGGDGWMYGCFSDCEIVTNGYNHSGLVSDLGYTGENLHYSYSANTALPPLTFGWGGSPENKTVGHSSYNDAVENLNKGIEMYNWTATVPCTYKFVKGDKPTMVYAEPSTNPGAGNNDFGHGGKF